MWRGAAGGSGLEELLVHVGAEGPTGGQRPAHKLLCHVPREGATCFQVLGAQGESICRGRSVEEPTPRSPDHAPRFLLAVFPRGEPGAPTVQLTQ